ncbi:hypothetical protein HON36_04440 [Candidatus Parcubacteria bacterium]|jgi:hypothetical protein|nr:hypothetical protein [Candidatus Parcubacteria bacterium]
MFCLNLRPHEVIIHLLDKEGSQECRDELNELGISPDSVTFILLRILGFINIPVESDAKCIAAMCDICLQRPKEAYLATEALQAIRRQITKEEKLYEEFSLLANYIKDDLLDEEQIPHERLARQNYSRLVPLFIISQSSISDDRRGEILGLLLEQANEWHSSFSAKVLALALLRFNKREEVGLIDEALKTQSNHDSARLAREAMADLIVLPED